MKRAAPFLFLVLCSGNVLSGQTFRFPTSNHTLLDNGGGERFFVGTTGRSWTSGMFGCVRTDGWQMHEGIDIKCLERDARGEPIDPVLSTAEGTVAYINEKAGLSNYGKYIVLKHTIEGLEIFSTYAHLSQIGPGIKIGHHVRAGERIATMGRTSNTRERISKDRAHVHFELNFFVNDRFPAWYQETFPDQRNDHEQWNGQNLLGLDPRLVLLEQAGRGKEFSLLSFIRNQPELCRVMVRDTSFPWLRRYPMLVRRNPVAEREGVAAYEISLNFNGIPFRLTPRAPRELTGHGSLQLLSVNAEEYQKHPCRKLVVKRGEEWEFGNNGLRFLELLTYGP